jgi:hypothetical protein
MAGLLSTTAAATSSRPAPVGPEAVPEERTWGGLLSEAWGNWLQSQRELWGVVPKVHAGLAEGVRQDPVAAATTASSAVPVVGDVVGLLSDAHTYATDPASRTWGNAALSAAGLLPFVPSMAGIFAGKRALTADLDAMAKAEKLAAEGADPREIYQQTGWFQGADKQWRFEIDDSAARFAGMGRGPVGDRKLLPEVLQHPELEAAYPSLYKYTWVERDTAAPDNLGEYHPQRDMIRLATRRTGAGSKTGQGSTVLHELQHAVQSKEDFARAIPPQEVFNDIMPRLVGSRRLLDDIERSGAVDFGRFYETSGITDLEAAAARYAAEKGIPIEEANEAATAFWSYSGESLRLDRLADLQNRTREFMRTAIDQPDEVYRRSAGEVEARAVEARRNMTPEQRRASFPPAGYDVPTEEQVVRWPGGLLGGGT